MVDGMFQDGKENAPTAEDLTQYAEDKDLLVAKHILLLTKDMTTGEDLSDAEKAEKKAKADDLLKQLQTITDPTELESKFDELMKANSEDTGLESSPDGYVFSAGKMVEAFESATRSLEPGQLSGIVESEFGYHIILRLDPATSKAFREQYSSKKLREMEQQWVDEADIKTTETYDNLSVADFYDKLTAYRDSLNTDADQAEEENQQVEQDTGDENAADSNADAAGDGTDANTDADANADADAQTDSADADKSDASNAADTATDTQDTGDSASQAQQ